MKRILWFFCWFASAACAQTNTPKPLERDTSIGLPPLVERLPNGAQLLFRYDQFGRQYYHSNYAFSLYDNREVVVIAIANMREPGRFQARLTPAEMRTTKALLQALSDSVGDREECGSGHEVDVNDLFHYRNGKLVRVVFRAGCRSDLRIKLWHHLLRSQSINRKICPHYFEWQAPF